MKISRLSTGADTLIKKPTEHALVTDTAIEGIHSTHCPDTVWLLSYAT